MASVISCRTMSRISCRYQTKALNTKHPISQPQGVCGNSLPAFPGVPSFDRKGWVRAAITEKELSSSAVLLAAHRVGSVCLFLNLPPGTRDDKVCNCSLLYLQFGLKLLASVPGTDCLGGALAAVLFSPEVVVFRHIHLGEAEAPVFRRRVAADGFCFAVPEKHGGSRDGSRIRIHDTAHDHALTQVLRLGQRQKSTTQGRHTGCQRHEHDCSRPTYAERPHSSSSSSSSRYSSSSSSDSSPTRDNSSGSTPTTSYSVPHSSQATTSPSSTSSKDRKSTRLNSSHP